VLQNSQGTEMRCVYVLHIVFVFLLGTRKPHNSKNVLSQCFIKTLFHEILHISFEILYMR